MFGKGLAGMSTQAGEGNEKGQYQPPAPVTVARSRAHP